MMRPPISAERLASLPPEIRSILVEVIDYYEARLATLQQRVDQLETENAQLKQRVRELETENAQLKQRVRELETENASLKSELDGVKKTPQNSSLPPSTQHPHAKPVATVKKKSSARWPAWARQASTAISADGTVR
jgi:predicted RNase H-like nuclease (RuvC/YqgF family)